MWKFVVLLGPILVAAACSEVTAEEPQNTREGSEIMTNRFRTSIH